MQRISRFIAALVLSSSVAHAATLEIPSPHTTLSGIGVVSGWKCDAGELTVRFDGGEPILLLHGAERADVLNAGACDHANVGFISIWNWGNLDDGEHTAVVYDDGVEFDRSVFTVRRFQEAFVTNASLTVSAQDFPNQGETAVFAWSQPTQHLELVNAFAAPTSTDPPNCAGWGKEDSESYRSPARVEACLEAGADPNARDADGNTPLHQIGRGARIDNWGGEMHSLLLAAGADPNARNNKGQTPLHSAMVTPVLGALEVVVVLLEAGADPNARDADGDTPLHYMYTVHSGDVERALIRAGADPNLLDADGEPHTCNTFECMAKKTYRMER